MRSNLPLVFSLLLALALATVGCKEKANKDAPANAAPAKAAETKQSVAPEAKVEAATPPGPGETKDTTANNKEASKPVNDEAAVATITKPFFYSVTGPEGESGYLLGTMHLGVDAATELPKIVWDALAESKSLTIEANITDIKVAMGLMLPPGQNLRDILGEETWSLLVEKLGESTAKRLLPMKPAAAASAIAIQGIKMTVPMDLALFGRADETGKTIHYLEDAEFQLAMLDKVMTVDTIREMLTNTEATDMKTMLQTYRAGDAEALLKEMEDASALGENGEEKLEALLYDRNENWIPKLEELFGQKQAFVAVGAAHLIGPRSVVALLSAKGYSIQRVAE
ncbi:MAG: TraB/GumN family protein [Myxococcales bacterium]|nr:TraB/GumN family protein [Myxococcales bacterium]